MTSGYRRPQKRVSKAVNEQPRVSCTVFKLCGASEDLHELSVIRASPCPVVVLQCPASGPGGYCSRNGLRELSFPRGFSLANASK